MNTIFKSSFLRAISKSSDTRLKAQIKEVILLFEKANSINEIPNLKKIKGFSGFYRIRVGQYRIGLRIDNKTVYFAAFAHRKDIYRIFP